MCSKIIKNYERLNMKKVYLVGLSLAVAGLVAGCGSSDSDGGGSNSLTEKPAEIVTVEDAKKAGGAVAQISTLGSFGSGFANQSSYAPSRNFARGTIPTQTQQCYNGGSYTQSGSYADDGSSFDMKMSYNNCDQGAGATNGSMRIKTNQSGNNIDMNLDMNDYSMVSAYGSYEMDIEMDISTNLNYNPMDINMNGSISYITSQYYFKAGYNNFRMNNNNNYVSIDGTVSMDSNLGSCMSGAYTIETLDPLYVDYNGFGSGSLKVNGTIYTYSGSSVQITLADGTTETVSQSELAGSCSN